MTRARWAWLIGMLLLVALLMRLRGISFGLPALNDPDELMFELGAVRMLREHTLNPGWFGHPATTTMYALAVLNVLTFLLGYLVGWFQSVQAFGQAIYVDPSWAILPGRVLMTAFGVGTVWLTWRLGTALHNRRTGLVAAVLLAVDPLAITYSQIIRSDMMACFFMMLCFLSAVRIAREDRWRDYGMASIWLGLAVATKWPFALSILAIFGAVVWRMVIDPVKRVRTIRRMIFAGMLSVLVLLAVSPFLVIDFHTVFLNLRGQMEVHHLGATGGPPLDNLWWYVREPIFKGLGIAGLIALALGTMRLRRAPETLLILGPFIIGYLVVLSTQHLIWERWALPLMPPLSIIAAVGLLWGLERLGRLTRGPVRRAVNIVVLALVLAPLVLKAQTIAQERMHDTRQQASHWAIDHIPAGSTVLIEHFAFDLVQQPWRFLFPLGNVGCVDAKAMLQGKISYRMIDRDRGGRSNVDFGTLAPGKRETCRADYAILTQYDRYRAEQQTFPAQYANYQWLLSHGKIVATFRPKPGQSGGPVVRVVHFDRPHTQVH